MGHAPVIWAAWGVTVIFLIVIKMCASRMARYEESQIFLGDSFEQEKSTQAAIVAKVHRIQPVQRFALWLMIAMSVVVVGYYVLDIVHQFD